MSRTRRCASSLLRACFRAPTPSRAARLAIGAGLICLFAVSPVDRARAATNVSGTISASTTWTLDGSPYTMTGNVTVASGVTLTIEEGVVVKGNSQLRQLIVNGSLSALGSSAAHITFTSTSDSAPGQWTGIKFGTSAATSTLQYVDVRNGGGFGSSDMYGMVDVTGGTVTIEDSTLTSSSVSGLKVSGGTSGTAASVTISRSKFESNGFSGSQLQGDGMNVFNAQVIAEDSAFWSNAEDGIDYALGGTYNPSPGNVTGSSIYGNKRYGVYLYQEPATTGLAPDGDGNAVYDNGTFGFSVSEKWWQLFITGASESVNWSNNYWGDVSVDGCGFGANNRHVHYGAPDPDPNTNGPIPRGPINHTWLANPDPEAYNPPWLDEYGWEWCSDDNVLSDPPAYLVPDLYFDAPPPTFGGLLLEQTFGCMSPCNADDPQVAVAHNAGPGNGFAYTPWPVNTASGSLTQSFTDLRLAGPGIPFAWSRTYNSRDATVGALGPGWAHPYAAKLIVSSDELDYRAGSGQRTIFKKITGGQTGAATYRARGFDGELKRLAQDDSFEMVTRDQRTFSFDSAGKLTAIKPRFLPATTLAYSSGKLSSITDSAGRTITLTYTSSDPSLIERVTLPDNRYVEYGYTSGRLTSVRDARGKTWTLAYDGNGRLQSIRDPVLRYELQSVIYDSQGRVTSEQNGKGDTITYAYTTSGSFDVTTVSVPSRGNWTYRHRNYLLFEVTDPLSRKTSYTYDAMGRLATVKDGRGYVRRFEYDDRGNVVREVAPIALGYTVTRAFDFTTRDLLSEKDGRGNTTSYAYATSSDSAVDYQVGQLKTATDREGGVTTFKYWTATSSPTPPATNVGLLKSVTNPRSKTISYDYDSSGNLTKVTSPLGLKTTMTYDSSGRLTSQRDPRGNMPVPPAGYLTQWAYDAVDHVTTMTDARGNATTYDYYDNELLWKETRTDRGSVQRVTTFEYDDANRLWKTTEPGASSAEIRLYWADGNLKELQSPESRKTTFSYDNAGQLISVVEPNGNAPGGTASDWTWTYGYDNAGNRTSEAHPDGGTRQIAYDTLNRPFQWTDALSHVTSVEYDANSNVTKRTNGLNKFRTFTYDKLDRLKTETDERSKTWTYEYWATGEPKSLTTPSPLSNKTTYALDDDGRTESMVEARGNVSGGNPALYTWEYDYDEAGNRTRVTDPLGNDVEYVFDELNQPTQVTDERGNATSLTYDVMNRLWKVTPPAAGGMGTLYTEYVYDARGNLASRTDPNAHTTTWTNDLDGLLTQRTTQVGTWNYAYFANGTLKTFETPAGSSTGTVGDGTITYGYDRMSRPTSTNYSDATPDVSRTYDLAGRLDSMTDGAGGTVDYTFNNADRLTDIARSGAVAGLNGTFHYDYDDAGNITGRTYPDGTTASAAFDEEGRLTSVTSASQTTSFGYDAAGNVTTVTLPSGNGHVATRTFDRSGRLTTVENAKAGTILSKFLWTLDAAGNPTKAQTTRGVNDVYDAFEYDTRNRLTASCFGVGSGATDCNGAANKITYAYDKVSNRTQEVRAGSVGNTGTIDYAYNAADQLTSTTKSGQSTTYTYDTNGNQASSGSRTFTYDLADRLASTANGGTTTTYGYDSDDRRVSSTVGGGGADLRLVWDPLAETGIPELALERTSGGSLVRRYLGGPVGTVSLTNSSATFYYHLDPLGTVTDVTDATGAAQWKYEYEAYGAERSATNLSGTAPENRLRFNSQYLDPETALYHLRARQYDSTIGRFGALDPVENRLLAPYDGAYGYVDGRPTVLIDPLGQEGFLADLGNRAVGGLEVLGNTAAGVADVLTMSFATKGLNAVGIHPNTNSTAFMVGQFGTYLIPARGGLALATAISRHGFRAVRGRLAIAAGAGGLNAAVGYGFSYFSCTPYSLQDALFYGGLGFFGGMRSPARGSASGRLPDDAIVVRGGQNTPKNFAGGTGVTVDSAGHIHGVSVNSASGRNIKELSNGIPNNQVGVTTAGEIRAAGGYITPDPLPNNPYHCLVGGCTPQQFSDLFNPTLPNPWKR